MDKKSRGTMNLILLIIGIFLLLFTVTMIWIFLQYEAIPDTLVSAVFVALGGECGAMAWIKSSKEKYKEREWEKEDRELEQLEEDTPDDLFN